MDILGFSGRVVYMNGTILFDLQMRQRRKGRSLTLNIAKQ
jgi:hypothetical protein